MAPAGIFSSSFRLVLDGLHNSPYNLFIATEKLMTDLLTMTQTTNKTEAFHAVFTDSELMAWWLASAETVRDKLARARSCRFVAIDPRYRHRLESVPADVLAVIDAFLEALAPTLDIVREALRSMRAEGLSWDATWSDLRFDGNDHGFCPGDARMLAAADFGMCPELTARLTAG